MFTLARSAGWEPKDRATTGTVGVDVGWRKRSDGLRVAYCVGDDGHEEEVGLPQRWLDGWAKADSLRSIRDKNFNEAREVFSKWLKKRKRLPDWLVEDTETLAHWRSSQRLARVARKWRHNRFGHDASGFDPLCEWAQQEDHLYEWEAGQRRKLQRWREDHYRCFAARLRRRYRASVREDLDFRVFHRRPEPGQEDPDTAVKVYVRAACGSLLVKCIDESMASSIKVPPEYTTMTCHECGFVEDFDRMSLEHTCSECGSTWDQDRNAAINLLRLGGGDWPVRERGRGKGPKRGRSRSKRAKRLQRRAVTKRAS